MEDVNPEKISEVIDEGVGSPKQSKNNFPEKRNFKRVKTTLRCLIKVSKDGVLIGRTSDVSEGGIGLILEQNINVEKNNVVATKLEYVLKGIQESFVFSGRIVGKSLTTDGSFRYNVSILKSKEENLLKFKKYIEWKISMMSN